MANNSKWKEYLLKSGLPLEYEVAEFLTSKGYLCDFDYTYIRENENEEQTEFSYDINAYSYEDEFTTELMVECKYRHESTKWLFLPEEYEGFKEIQNTSFLHASDHFSNKDAHSLLKSSLMFAPLCSKGIEITTQGQNPKTITQATTQLSYALAEKYTVGFISQIGEQKKGQEDGNINLYIPVIITTAELYRLNTNITINDIKESDKIEDVATKLNSIVLTKNESMSLGKYNQNIFDDFLEDIDRDDLHTYLNSFKKNPEFVMNTIANHYCPSCFIVIHHSPDNNGLNDLIKYVDAIIKK